MKPGKGAFNDPSVFAQVRGTIDTTPSNPVQDMALGTGIAASGEVVALVSVELLGAASGFTMAVLQEGDRVQHRLKQQAVVHIGRTEHHRQRNAVAVCDQVMFGAGTASIYWVPTCVRSPFFACPIDESIQARLQSIFPSSCSS